MTDIEQAKTDAQEIKQNLNSMVTDFIKKYPELHLSIKAESVTTTTFLLSGQTATGYNVESSLSIGVS